MPETIEIACCVRCMRESIVVIRCSIVAESCPAVRRSWGEGMCRDPVSGEVESGGEFFGEVADGGPSSTVSGFATGA